jgi:predicted DNA binding protein
MITARVGVQYEGDWTADSVQQDVYGKFLAYSFVDNRYFALLVLTSSDLEATIGRIRGDDTIVDVQVIDRTLDSSGVARSVTLVVKSQYREIPPLEMLTYEGFFPIGYPSLEHGRIYFDLLLETRADIDSAIDLLSEFGDVSVEYLSEDLLYLRAPTLDEFEALAESITPRQLEILTLAVASGYFEPRRAVTTEALAAELGISKTTASRHLRKARLKVVRFVDRYLNEASDGA